MVEKMHDPKLAYHDEDEELVVVDPLEQQRHPRKHTVVGKDVRR